MADIQSLVARMQCGDASAFEEFAASYRDKIYALALSLAGNRADAEDLTQEVLLKIYLDFQKYAKKAGSFEAFIYRMAVNLWIDWVRRRKRVQVFSIEGALDEEEGGPTVELAAPEEGVEAVHRKEFSRAVWKAWGELPENYRLLLKLRAVDHLSYREIAATVGETEAAVKCKVSRGRSLLKEKLRQSGFDSRG